MIVETRLRHRADVLPARSRKTKKAFVESDVAFRLKDVPAADAPVALRPLRWGGGRYDVRFHDGLLWRVPEKETDGGFALHQDPSSAIARFMRDTEMDGRDPAASKGNRIAGGDAPVVSTTRDDVVSLVQEWLDREWLAIDGVPHMRARSPLFSMVEIMKGFGHDVAMTNGVMPAIHVPAWFPHEYRGAPLREHLSELPEQHVFAARMVLQALDVEVVRPDLMEVAGRSEACNVDPSGMIENASSNFGQDPRPHLSLPADSDPESQRRQLIERLMMACYDAAAHDGATFGEATQSARLAMKQIPQEPRDPLAIVLPAPDEAVRVYLDVHRMGLCSIASIDPTSTTRIAVAASTENYFADASGSFYVAVGSEPEFEAQGMPQEREITAGTLNRMARGLTERRGHCGPDSANHMGESLRHRDGVKDPKSKKPEVDALREFALHRLARMGRRIVLRCPEPVIVVDPYHDKSKKLRPHFSHSISCRTAPEERPPLMFRLDQMDEAMHAAGNRGPFDRTELDAARILDVDRLAFDSALWNLRSTMKRIVKAIDGRALLLDGAAAIATARLDKHLESWSEDSALVASDEAVAGFIEDAGVFLSAIEHPLMEDIGEDWIREIARTSLERAMGERRIIGTEPAEELVGFSM
jgi:hypothetical protein